MFKDRFAKIDGAQVGPEPLQNNGAEILDETQPIDELLPEGMDDPDWIPTVGDLGWVVITNDRHNRTRPVEAQLAIEHKLKVVHLHGKVGNAAAWDQLTRLTTRWEAVRAQLAKHPEGPWWLSLRRASSVVMRFEPGMVERR